MARYIFSDHHRERNGNNTNTRCRSLFRSTCIKPYIPPTTFNDSTTDDAPNHQHKYPHHEKQLEPSPAHRTTTVQPTLSQAKSSLTKKVTNAITLADFHKEELYDLLRNGRFEPVQKDAIPASALVFGSRFIAQLEKSEDGTRCKTRLVAHNYAEDWARFIATKAPTVQRLHTRLLFSLAASIRYTSTFSRDISQANIQSPSDLVHDVYIITPAELHLHPGTILKIIGPLYGVPGSDLHWYMTYLDFHESIIQMFRTPADPCVLVRRLTEQLEANIILQVY